jgi:hypothetical protein
MGERSVLRLKKLVTRHPEGIQVNETNFHVKFKEASEASLYLIQYETH